MTERGPPPSRRWRFSDGYGTPTAGWSAAAIDSRRRFRRSRRRRARWAAGALHGGMGEPGVWSCAEQGQAADVRPGDTCLAVGFLGGLDRSPGYEPSVRIGHRIAWVRRAHKAQQHLDNPLASFLHDALHHGLWPRSGRPTARRLLERQAAAVICGTICICLLTNRRPMCRLICT